MHSCNQRYRKTKKTSEKAGRDNPLPERSTNWNEGHNKKNDWWGQFAAVTIRVPVLGSNPDVSTESPRRMNYL